MLYETRLLKSVHKSPHIPFKKRPRPQLRASRSLGAQRHRPESSNPLLPGSHLRFKIRVEWNIVWLAARASPLLKKFYASEGGARRTRHSEDPTALLLVCSSP